MIRWHLLPDRPLRTLVLGQPRPGAPELALVPGLGALGYVLPTVRACSAWTRVHLLDVPGFGHRVTSGQPADLGALATAVVGWLDRVPDAPVLLAGHSTGAQAALRAAFARPDAVHALAPAGVTFPPHLRSLPALGRAVLATLPHEQPGELPAVAPYYLRGARRLPQLLRSALADRPEDIVARLPPPVHVLHGEHDRLCPQDWARLLAARARDGRAVALPGGHNTPWTHPVETAWALRDAAGQRPAR